MIGPSIRSFLGLVPAEDGFYYRDLAYPVHNQAIDRNRRTAENDGNEAVDDAVVGPLGPGPGAQCSCKHSEPNITDVYAPVMEHPKERQQVHKGLQGYEGGL